MRGASFSFYDKDKPVPKISKAIGRKVYKEKKPGKDGSISYAKVGKVHQAIFSPDGLTLIGWTIKRPDIAGMVKRSDLFVPREGLEFMDKGLLLTVDKTNQDEAALNKLGVSWNNCLIWEGMDVVTTKGKNMGFISDVTYAQANGHIKSVQVSDGSMSEKVVGGIEVPVALIKGYHKGRMVVSKKATELGLSGGLAGKAGEAAGKAQLAGQKVAKVAGKKAGKALEQGSYGLGKALGKAKRATEGALAEHLPADEADTPSSERVAKAVGKQLGRAGKMFSSFKEEFDKSSS